MSRLIDLAGKKFGMLSVIKKSPEKKNGQTMWDCVCDCGKNVTVRSISLRKGDTTSCGCIRSSLMRKKKTIHGAYHGRTKRDRLYNIYSDMKYRCYNKNAKAYKNYGGRGIKVCQEWLFDYSKFRDWALANGYSDTLTIDRIDNDRGYFPENCRWATRAQQNANRRIFCGKHC